VDDTAPASGSPNEPEALAAAHRVIGETRARWALRLAGRMAGRLLGALLLAAGLVKAVAPTTFAQEILGYGIVTQPYVAALLAYAIVIVECGLGAALVANLRPRIALALTALLLVVFLGAVGYAWYTGSTADCGCFGPWKRTPRQAFFEDVVLLAVIPWAWWGRGLTHAKTNAFKLGFVGVAVAAGIMVPAVAGMAAGEPGAAGAVGSEAFKTMEVRDLPVNLATGEHLVLLMSTQCSHCQEAVPEVNALVDDQRLPRLVAVAMETRAERGLFREDYGARYPIGEISESDVRSLMKKAFPRLFLVREGRIVEVWDEKIPPPDEILAAGQR
jgi:hypothetical protein